MTRKPFHGLLVNKIPPRIPLSVFFPPSFKRNMLLTCQSVLTVCDRPPATECIRYSCTLTSVPITLAAVSKAALFGHLARGRLESHEAQRGRRVFRTITSSSFTFICRRVCPSEFLQRSTPSELQGFFPPLRVCQSSPEVSPCSGSGCLCVC